MGSKNVEIARRSPGVASPPQTQRSSLMPCLVAARNMQNTPPGKYTEEGDSGLGGWIIIGAGLCSYPTCRVIRRSSNDLGFEACFDQQLF
jgi:hypothetical protein